MDVPRVAIRGVLEWIVAAACILVAAGLCSRAFQELRGVRAMTPVIADERAIPDAPASIFPGAVSVPMLLLSTGDELRVGQHAAAIGSRLNEAWQIGSDAIERSTSGRRIIRRFDDGATQFALVFEATAAGEDRVVAIYLR